MIQHDSRVSKLVTCFFRTLHTINVIKIATIFGPFLRDSKRLICCESHGLIVSYIISTCKTQCISCWRWPWYDVCWIYYIWRKRNNGIKNTDICIVIFCVSWCYVLRWIWCLWCYSECASTPGKLKSLPDHGGNRTRDLWDTSPMLYQLSYEVNLTSIQKVACRFDCHRGQANFSACPVWMHTQSNTTNIIFTWVVHNTNTHNIIDIEGTRLSSEISPTRTDLTT